MMKKSFQVQASGPLWGRKTLRYISALGVLALCLAQGAFTEGRASAAVANTVTAVHVEKLEGGARDVVVQTTTQPTFTVFRLASPARIVLDLSGGDVSQLKAPVVIEDGVVGQIATQQFNSKGFLVGRITIGLEQDQAYDVRSRGHAVVVHIGQSNDLRFASVTPPLEAPADRVAAERYEKAKAEADKALRRVQLERAEAKRANAEAAEQQQAAKRLAQEARALQKEARAAQKEMEAKREAVTSAASLDRKAAEQAAREAEARLRQIEKTAQEVQLAKSDAQSLALRADQARRDAEETAARANVEHKHRLTALHERNAELEKEAAKIRTLKLQAEQARQEAKTAEQEARARKQEADGSRKALQKKMAELERDRESASKRLAEAEHKERQLNARGEKVQAQAQALSRLRQEIAAEQDELKETRERLSHSQDALNEQKRSFAEQQKTFAQERSAFNREKQRLNTEIASAEAGLRDKDAALQAGMGKDKTRLARERDVLRKQLQASQSSLAQLEKRKKRLDTREEEIRAAERTKIGLELSKSHLVMEQRRLRKTIDKNEATLSTLAKRRSEVAAGEAKLEKARAQVEEERLALEQEKVRLKSLRAQTVVTKVAAARMSNTKADRHRDRRSVSETVQLLGVKRGRNNDVLLALRGNVEFMVERVEDPPRLVIDLKRTSGRLKRHQYDVHNDLLRRVRLGEHGKDLRAVFDLRGPNTSYEVRRNTGGLVVALNRRNKPQVAQVNSQPQTAGSTAQRASSGDVNEVSAVEFSGDGMAAHIVMELGDDKKIKTHFDDRSARAWVLDLKGVTLKKSLEKSLDTTAYGTVVRLVSAYQANPNTVRLVANLTGPATSRVVQKGSTLRWIVSAKTRPPSVVSGTTQSSETASFVGQAARSVNTLVSQTSSGSRSRRRQRVSLNFRDADIVAVLRFIAEKTGQNIIVADSVKGKVTLKLRQVPWDVALDTILKTKGYDKVRDGSILRIAPAEDIQRERQRAIANKKAKTEAEETAIKIITINYAEAVGLPEQLKPVLSERGSVTVNERTNSIIIEDIISNVGRVVELARRLDRQTPQVLIEARIVEATTNELNQLGVQWGGTGQATQRNGNPTGVIFPNDLIVSGAADSASSNLTQGVATPSRYAVNLPAPIGTGSGGGLGFVFGSADGSQLLNLRLSALEERGSGRILSSPRITTLDNQKATISQGVDIPITVVSANGANTRFVPARLVLEATPHVTNDGSIILKLKVTKNAPDFANPGASGDPSITNKEAQTTVLVPDGGTTVIGGIYQRVTSKTVSGIPFLSSIPIIGALFRSTRTEDVRSELLIFVTPRIVNRQESLLETTTMKGRKLEVNEPQN